MKPDDVTIFISKLERRTITNYIAPDVFDDLFLARSLSYASGLVSRAYLLPEAKMQVDDSHLVYMSQTWPYEDVLAPSQYYIFHVLRLAT